MHLIVGQFEDNLASCSYRRSEFLAILSPAVQVQPLLVYFSLNMHICSKHTYFFVACLCFSQGTQAPVFDFLWHCVFPTLYDEEQGAHRLSREG